ncbi:DUF2909 family protein [Inmirania thermothiophila]|uniref:DUF2909 family protein n=1 Tax=Inmirania thermothiophila TaxID=1750597 RepID=A0A3N1Y574_9GAMM|nr:DUF2909 family protein [Inmirania thermothiophila]ROR32782.1 DUF2909 family protein [Inmirania thermothiophila]
MALWFKIPLLILLGLILLSLVEAMIFLSRDDGRRDRTRMVRALTVRIALSLVLFAILMGGYFLGVVGPHGR